MGSFKVKMYLGFLSVLIFGVCGIYLIYQYLSLADSSTQAKTMFKDELLLSLVAGILALILSLPALLNFVILQKFDSQFNFPNGPLYTELLDILSDPGLVKEDSSYEGNFDEDPPKVPKSLIPPQQGLVRLELKQNNEIIIKEMPSETFANVIYALQEEDKEKAIEILSNLGDKPYKEKYETSNISIKQFKKDEEQDEEKDVGDVQEKQKLTETFVVPIPNDFKITDLVNLTPSELVNALKIDQLGDLPIKSEPNM